MPDMPQAIRLTLLRAISLVVLALVCAQSSGQNDGAQTAKGTAGQEAFSNGNYEEARRIWEPLARDGDVLSQFGLGQLYFEGLSVKRSFTEAVKWFRLAAEQSFGPAQYNLGNAYKHGRGVAQSDSQAAQWWRQAAEQEIAPAQYNLATSYYFGRGVLQDEREALRWYRRAADNDHPGARDIVAQIEAVNEQAAAAPVVEPVAEAGSVETTDESVNASAAAASAPALVQNESTEASRWLMAQSPSNFTIQVFVSSTEQNVQAFLAANQFEYPTDYFRFELEGREVYGAVSGSFDSFAQARVALSAMQYSLRRTKDEGPWIRRFGDIQRILLRQ